LLTDFDMSPIGMVILFYAVATVLLIAEIFVPSHCVLTIAGIGFLILAIVKTFDFGNTAGVVSVLATLVLLPTFAVTAVKVWPHTWIGRMIAPPNPVYTPKDLGADVEEIKLLIGKYGRSLTPLRPVGTCEFAGRRIQCVAESGMIARDVKVVAVGMKGRDLQVAAADGQASV